MKIIKHVNLFLLVSATLIIILYGINSIVVNNYTTFLLCILLLIGFFGIYYIDIRRYKISEEYKFIYLFFLFLAAVLGALVNLYKYVGFYDDIMHFISGILSAYIGYIIYFKYNNKYNIIAVIFVISFNLGIASCWEFIEYSIDIVFNLDTQKVALYGVGDTMQDMLDSLIGAIILITIYNKKIRLLYA